MTVNDLTEKQVDVLVNGNLQDSFDQRANNADYDVSVSDVQSFNWSGQVDTEVDDRNNETHGLTGGYLYFYYHYDYDDPDDEAGYIEFRDADGNVLHSEYANSSPDDNEAEKTLDLPNATEIHIENNDAQYGFTVIVERATNEMTFTDKVGNSHRIPTGFSVDGVTQS